MSNVLPQHERKHVNRVYRARFMMTGALVVISVAALAALAFLPAYLSLRQAPQAAPVQKTVDTTDFSAIARTQALLHNVAPLFVATTTPADAVELALSLKNAGVHVDHITYASGKEWTITLGGVADKPADLGAYKTALLGAPLFTNVDLPVSNLVGAPGGRFSITIAGHF